MIINRSNSTFHLTRHIETSTQTGLKHPNSTTDSDAIFLFNFVFTGKIIIVA